MYGKMFTSVLGLAVLGILGISQLTAGDDCCGDSCCEAPKKHCISVPETKKLAKQCYDCKCEEFCVPRCGKNILFKGWFPKENPCCEKCCDNSCPTCPTCDEGRCGKVRTKKMLVVKTKRYEEQGFKCVVTEGCSTGCCDGPTIVPAPVMGEPIPAPKAK